MSKINLPTAEERRNQKRRLCIERGNSMSALARRFINGKLRKAILESDSDCVNEAIPIDAYKDIDLFATVVEGSLRPLGYHCERSHDGGGMYDTIFVSW